jgi:hypothetical protein
MSNTFEKWSSRVAVAARVAQERRRPENWNEMPEEEYDQPLDKVEAQTKAAKWPWNVYII